MPEAEHSALNPCNLAAYGGERGGHGILLMQVSSGRLKRGRALASILLHSSFHKQPTARYGRLIISKTIGFLQDEAGRCGLAGNSQLPGEICRGHLDFEFELENCPLIALSYRLGPGT